MNVKTQDLIGEALDLAVAECVGLNLYVARLQRFSPSTNWAQGGPIIERENIEWQWLPAPDKAHQYGARKPSLGGLNRTFCMDGPTVLIAAMRCYVASRLGDEVEVPEELLK